MFICGIILMMSKPVQVRVVFFQATTISADPEHMLFIFKYAKDVIIVKGERVFWVIPENFHLIAIVFIKAILCSEPHKAFGILNDTLNEADRKPLVGANTPELNGLAICGTDNQKKRNNKGVKLFPCHYFKAKNSYKLPI